VRNIPNGAFSVGAGRSGYYTLDSYMIEVTNGRPAVNGENVVSYNFEMGLGNRTIVWNVNGYDGVGEIKIISPLNRSIDFDYTPGREPVVAEITGVGPGSYVIEAVAESSPNLLQLSRYRFEIAPNANDEEVEPENLRTEINVYFPLLHNHVDTLAKAAGSDWYRLYVLQSATPHQPVVKAELFYRSEGSARFRSMDMDVGIGQPIGFDFTPSRDGTNLHYYFRVTLADGTVYGSDKQVFVTFVKPDPQVITRLVIEPGALDGDALYMPSSYTAQFKLTAFYSDMFVAIDEKADIGTVQWSILNENGDEVRAAGTASNAVFTYTTPENAQNFILRAELIPSPSSGYSMKPGRESAVSFPIRVTGAALESMVVSRRGNAEPISSTENAGFRIDALDRDNNNVSVSPAWSVVPANAGTMSSDGVFTPRPDFFGNVRVIATAGGRSAEYGEHGDPGQKGNFTRRHRNDGSDTLSTLRGLRFVFPVGSVPMGETVDFESHIPELTNLLHKVGSDGFRMADTIAFDIVAPTFNKIENQVYIIFDVPGRLWEAARKGDHEFRVARWSEEELLWIPIENSEVSADGATVMATLSNTPSMARAAGAGRGKGAAVTGLDAAAMLSAYSRYALITRTRGLSVDVSVSPHPFSPYIRPVREHGPNAREGTCIRVNIEAPEASVRSIKVHIYNATGTRVWAVDKLNAEVGVNEFWWNGRTSGRGNGRTQVTEQLWEGFDNSDKPLVRNGRYFVTIIVTDWDGKQKRLMRPVVVMK
jgi:hypothetical protein